RQMVEYAKRIGLDALAITDHDEIRGSLEALKYVSDDFKLIPGVEVTSLEGHILCLGINEVPKKHQPAIEIIDFVHELGGVAIAAHPYDRLRGGVGDLIFRLDFDAVELINGHTLSSTRRLDEIAKKVDKPITGGSDAHIIDDIGSVYMITGDNVLDCIRKGSFEVISTTSKIRIISGLIKSRIRSLL
ncbi:MAG: hypothetical protein B6U97_03675, partial [Candidatus Altiarchaeales archaeon ex4484_96]